MLWVEDGAPEDGGVGVVEKRAVDAVDVAEVVVNGEVIRKNAALVQSALQRVIVW